MGKLFGIVYRSTFLVVTPGNNALMVMVTNEGGEGVRCPKDFRHVLQVWNRSPRKLLSPRYNGTICSDSDASKSWTKNLLDVCEIGAAGISEGLRIPEGECAAICSQHNARSMSQLDFTCMDNL